MFRRLQPGSTLDLKRGVVEGVVKEEEVEMGVSGGGDGVREGQKGIYRDEEEVVLEESVRGKEANI